MIVIMIQLIIITTQKVASRAERLAPSFEADHLSLSRARAVMLKELFSFVILCVLLLICHIIVIIILIILIIIIMMMIVIIIIIISSSSSSSVII